MIHAINDIAKPIGNEYSYDALLDQIGDAHIVLIGEATHGTQEFYQARIEITRALIEQKNFKAIAIEGDWPDAYTLHRYINGASNKAYAKKALEGFQRFPSWMWRNETLPPFLRWLRTYNDNVPIKNKVGFYGLDLYSLHTSMQAVIDYLSTIDPEAAENARSRYSCFDHLNLDPESYGYLTSAGIKKSCVQEAIQQLLELQCQAIDYVQQDDLLSQEEYFYITQNARLVKNAELYYRAMFEDHIYSWNIRDQHMTETLNQLITHLTMRQNIPAKIVVWAHNSHVGDARATEFGERGELNMGQLVRDQYGTDAYLIGFSTYQGTVTAASEWDKPAECKKINPGIPGSYEALFHDLQYKNFLLDLRSNRKSLHSYLQFPRLQRAIGVLYLPETERESHYFFTHLLQQFDSMIHFDKTTAVKSIKNRGK